MELLGDVVDEEKKELSDGVDTTRNLLITCQICYDFFLREIRAKIVTNLSL